MTALVSLLAVLALVALAAWVFGSLVLRAGGLLLAFAGLIALATGAATAGPGLLVLVVGALAWLAGHWLYAYRHHGFRTPLARRIFLRVLPRRLDPSRGWGLPVVHRDRSQI